MKSRILFIAIMLLGTIVTMAQVRGNGNVTKESRNVGNFTSIKLTCSADLYITQGSAAVTVETDENIVEMIKTEVSDDVLYIGVKGRGFRSVEKLRVYITAPSLEKLMNSGSGDIYFDGVFNTNDLYININGSGDLEADLKATNVEIKINGSGDTEISGIMGMFKATVSGSGDIDAENLRLEECYIKNSGSGDISLEGKTNVLTVNQNGSGDLDAYHFVAVNATVSNSGSSDISLHVVEKLQVRERYAVALGAVLLHATPFQVHVLPFGIA